jgi:hypothetical protein
MTLRSHSTFVKALQRIRMLYEVSVHSYDGMYQSGKRQLRGGSHGFIEIEIAGRKVSRPLKVVTFHSKDVYPQLLRATLLVRLVTAFEVFLVDVIEEVSQRSDAPFETEAQIQLTQRQLLTLNRQRKTLAHVVSKTTRALTSGGLEEIKKFYAKFFDVSINPPTASFIDIQEIHERRHIHVHRAGYADEQYVHRFPFQGAKVDEILAVGEDYLLRAFELLAASARHITATVELKYPEGPGWVRVPGGKTDAAPDEQMLLVSAFIIERSNASALITMCAPLSGALTLRDVSMWAETRNEEIRWLICARSSLVTSFFKVLAMSSAEGVIRGVEHVKLLPAPHKSSHTTRDN